MVGTRLHVHARQGIHHPRNRGLSRPWLRARRLLRGRYRRAALVDRAAHRLGGRALASTAAIWTVHARSVERPADAAGRRSTRWSGPMRRLRRTKIVATLGPASSERSMIDRLFKAGADMFRINMSHTSHDRMRELVASIRAVETEHGRPIGILCDLQGPKLRIGSFKDDAVTLVPGADFILDSDPVPGDIHRVQLPHPEILAALEPGHTLLLDDGKIRLHALETARDHARTQVDVGGRLTARKGVSLPDTIIPSSAMTAKDRSDLD